LRRVLVRCHPAPDVHFEARHRRPQRDRGGTWPPQNVARLDRTEGKFSDPM
jgi:hypothetical protein